MAFTSNVSTTVTGQTVIAGTQTIINGGVANTTAISSGGVQRVSSGGVANSTTINSSGGQTVYAYGAVTSTIISGWGSWQTISSGGTATITTIDYAGGQYVKSGGTANSTIVNSDGGQTVSAGGTVLSTTVNSGGYLFVYGAASQSLIQSGGLMMIGNGGNVSGFTMTSCGIMGWDFNAVFSGTSNGVAVVSSSGKISYNLHLGNLNQYVSSGYTADSATIGIAAGQYVSSGGTATNTTIESGGAQYVSSGGVANFTTINSGSGGQWVYAGGTANSTTINLYGYQYISSGGVANSTIIFNSGFQAVSSGGSANDTTINDGYQRVSGTANNTVINSGGQQEVSGGSANLTIINSSGDQYIYSCCTANSTTINISGHQFIYSGGIACDTTINGGSQRVNGTATSTTVNSGGFQSVSSGGTVNCTTINSGGLQLVSSCGTANSTTIYNFGSQYVFFGGMANNTTVSGFAGSQYISSGGTASSTVIYSGGQGVSSGGTAVDTNIFRGYQNIYNGGIANSTTIDDFGWQFVSSGGTASNTIINSSYQRISSGGIANSTTINSSGWQNVFGGGVANFSIINSGAQQIVSSGAIVNNTTVNAGAQVISSGGAASNTTISGGTQTVGGIANITTIYNGGWQNVNSGGIANLTTVNYGNQSVSSGGVANSTTINAGGQVVSAGGTATNTSVNSGGWQFINSGGTATATTVNSSGAQSVNAGGIANSTTINSAGKQYVCLGAITINTAINSGGSMSVLSGGNVAGVLTISGGHVILEDAASISGLTTLSYVLTTANTNDVLLTANAGTLGIGVTAYYLKLDNTATGSYILADGVDLSGMIGKTFSVTDNSQTIDLTVGSSYTFSNGDKLLLNYTDSTRDQLTAVLVYLPQITISVTDAVAGEPSDNGTYRISRTGDTTNALTVNFSTGGTATSGSDYMLKNGSTALTNSVVIAAGQSYVDVMLAVIDDVIVEGAETAVINLTANAAYSLGATASGTINITDDDKFTSIVSSMTVNGETVSSGTQSIVNGGIANNTIINISGYQNISSGGSASSTIININGYQNISSGGVATSTTINSGGYQNVSFGGTASSVTVNLGGNQTVSSGGVASSIVIKGLQLISSGGVANSNTISAGGNQTVSSGGTANYTTISSGLQVVSSGGVANFSFLSKGGQNVSSGGVANFTIIYSSSYQFIFAGSANTTAISGGVQTVFSGGVANGTDINSGGIQNLGGGALAGGVANSTNINSFGSQLVSSGGAANSTNINYAGYQYVSSGGVAISTTISNGNQYVSSGGVASSTTINWGYQYVYYGGIANSTTLNSNGCQWISGGIASNTIINYSGYQYISYGGLANSTTINTGIQSISSGGVAISTTINSGGFQNVSYGGEANSTTINSGCSQNVFGTASNTIINSGGFEYVSSGGTANSITLNSGGRQYVYSGGAANLTTIYSGGSQYFASGGAANVINQQSGAVIIADTGATITGGTNTRADGHSAFSLINGIASNFLLEYGGGLYIASGQSSIDTLIASGGFEYVSSGGTANSITLNSGGRLYVSGTANVINQQYGAAIIVGTAATITDGINTRIDGHSMFSICNGIASNFLMENGGRLTISSGQSAIDTVIDGSGYQYVSSGGETNATTINFGGYQYVSSGGVANSTTINSGGYQYTQGNASQSMVNSGGMLMIGSGGSAIEFSISSGGILGWDFNAVMSGTSNGVAVVSSSDKTSYNLYLNGNSQLVGVGYTANSTTIYSLWQDVSGGVANYTTINSGAQDLYSGGVANFATINSGWQWVGSGGVAISTTISSGGWQSINSGGMASNTIVNSGGSQCVYAGVASNTTINSGGSQYISSGGMANYTTVNSGGIEYVSSSGVASNTIVNSGGCQNLSSGGLAGNTIVNSGGSMYASSGGIVAGMLTIGGGHVTVKNINSLYLTAVVFKLANTQINDTLLTIQSGAADDISHNTFTLDVNNTATGTYILESGANLAGMSGAVFTVKDEGQVIYAQVGYSYTLADGDKLSLSLTDGATKLAATFTLDTFAPSMPSGLIRTITGNSVAFDWNDSTDADSGVKQYQVIVDNNADFSSPEYSASPVASAATVNSLADGIYYWKVRTQDNAGNYSDWTVGSSFTVDTATPSVPATLTRNVTGNSVALDWADATDTTSGVKQYEFQVDNDSDFSSNEKSGTVAVSNANVTSLADGNYYWRVRTLDNSGNYSDWTTGSSFTVDVTAPSVPANLTRTVTGNSVALDWADAADATSGVKQYEVQLDKHADFSSPEYSLSPVASTATISNLTDGTFYWRVRTQDNVGNYSDWTSGSNFVSDVDGTISGALLLSSPSTTGRVGTGDAADYYKITMTNAGMLTLGLTGLTGNADLSLLNASGIQLKASSNAGTTPEAINNVALLAGTYYIKVAPAFGVKDAIYTLTHAEKYCPEDKAANDYKTALDISNLDNWVGFGDVADFYKLTMTNAGTLTLGLTGLTGNADLSLLNSAGTAIKTSSNAGVTPEAITNVLLLAGTYYVKVAAGTSVNDASYTLSNTIKYCPTDKAANDYKTALDISNLDNWVGFGDSTDFYKLTMTNAGTLTLGLTGLTGNADLSLLNASGIAIKTSSNIGNTSEAINNVVLLAGTYYVKVAAGFGVNDAAYTLTNTIKYCPADKAANDYKTALDISNLDNWVGFGDSADFYKLTMTNAGTLTLGLTGLTGNADLALLNSAGTALKTSSNTGTAPEAINNVALLAGTYYVKVAAGFGVNDATYTLTNTIKYCPTDKAANDYKTAQDISNLDNWVGFGDAADFYKLTMANAGTLTLGLTGLTGNADLSLLSTTGTVLKSSSNTGNTSEAINNVALLAGTYYVKVAAGTSVNDASYNLTNTIKYCPTDKAANDYATAKDIKSGVDNWVGFGDTADFYKLTMTNAGTLSLDLTGLTGNVDMSLLNSAGTVLKSSANTGITNEAISNVSLLAGTYYVKIATGFGVNDAYYTLSDLEKYFPLDNAGNTQATAKLVDSPTQTGWVGFGDSDDYYKFDVANTTQGTLRLHDMAGGNADLTLYDSKGTMLQKSAKTGTLEDTITRNLAAGTYYARVTAVSGNIDYKLDFSKKDIVSGMLAG